MSYKEQNITKMFVYFTIVSIFLIPLSSSSTMPPPQLTDTTNKLILSPELGQEKNKKLVIPSEGGSLTSNIPATLSKDNQSLLLSLDKDQVKNKEKSVVARKGVKYVPTEDSSQEHLNLIPSDSTKKPILEASLIPSAKKSSNDTLNGTSTQKTVKVHKPLVLSSEQLEKLGPDSEYEPSIKIRKVNENSRPDLIMPIVITILVVPMFAVVGYMAIKRGREAWKNRHYKRMDFLLDGMYND